MDMQLFNQVFYRLIWRPGRKLGTVSFVRLFKGRRFHQGSLIDQIPFSIKFWN